MDINKNYYEILGVDKKATEDDIKKIFRKKANETHPDKHGGDDSDFKKINEAYQILGDKEKRSQYDVKSPNGNNYQPMGDFHTFFSQHFGGGGNPFDFFGGNDPFDVFRRRKPDFYEELDTSVKINVTLEDIYNDKNVKVKFRRNVHCSDCNGSGFDKNSESYECDICDGTGKVWENVVGEIKCKYCNGTGRIHSGICKKCNGNKLESRDEEFQLNNTHRLVNSETKYFQGYGHQSKYFRNKRGNLILDIVVIDNNKFERKRDGLYYKLDLHYEDAINGMDFEFIHLDGKKYKIVIPPKTKNGDILNMKNKGLLINPQTRQNLYFVVNIIIDYSRVGL